MFIDIRSLPPEEQINTDLAIIGAGAAGISMARALRGTGIRIALLESGGLEFSETAQALAAGDLGEQNYAPLDQARIRAFGGTTWHWGGWCRELDAIDFESRDFVPLSGWPITKENLSGYYAAARRLLQLDPLSEDDPYAYARRFGLALPMAKDAPIEPCLFAMSPPTNFGQVYFADIDKAPNITVYLNATVTALNAAEDAQSIRTLTISREGAPPLELSARNIVLACGGIDNARLLLVSDEIVQGGIGNGADNVGRYFADHAVPMGYAALLAISRDAFAAPLFEERIDGTRRWRLAFNPSERARRENKLVSTLITVEPSAIRFDRETKKFTEWFEAWYGNKERAELIAALHAQADGPLTLHPLNAGLETRPNRESRVTLTGKRDALGMRKPKLDWRLSDDDLKDYRTALAMLAQSFGGKAIAYLQPHMADRFPQDIAWGHHHMGTTRMGDDPATSVVDAECRVHGMRNLWIAGSSVFPTYGAANPTITIVALALRLAERLKREFA
ncbi:MAG: GMC family oxidoreductase [Alphaproteobacteria bacterium]|nr:GMC family oxidoreductase [Alphaproteobacteria bacterium]